MARETQGLQHGKVKLRGQPWRAIRKYHRRTKRALGIGLSDHINIGTDVFHGIYPHNHPEGAASRSGQTGGDATKPEVPNYDRYEEDSPQPKRWSRFHRYSRWSTWGDNPSNRRKGNRHGNGVGGGRPDRMTRGFGYKHMSSGHNNGNLLPPGGHNRHNADWQNHNRAGTGSRREGPPFGGRGRSRNDAYWGRNGQHGHSSLLGGGYYEQHRRNPKPVFIERDAWGRPNPQRGHRTRGKWNHGEENDGEHDSGLLSPEFYSNVGLLPIIFSLGGGGGGGGGTRGGGGRRRAAAVPPVPRAVPPAGPPEIPAGDAGTVVPLSTKRTTESSVTTSAPASAQTLVTITTVSTTLSTTVHTTAPTTLSASSTLAPTSSTSKTTQAVATSNTQGSTLQNTHVSIPVVSTTINPRTSKSQPRSKLEIFRVVFPNPYLKRHPVGGSMATDKHPGQVLKCYPSSQGYRNHTACVPNATTGPPSPTPSPTSGMSSTMTSGQTKYERGRGDLFRTTQGSHGYEQSFCNPSFIFRAQPKTTVYDRTTQAPRIKDRGKPEALLIIGQLALTNGVLRVGPTPIGNLLLRKHPKHHSCGFAACSFSEAGQRNSFDLREVRNKIHAKMRALANRARQTTPEHMSHFVSKRLLRFLQSTPWPAQTRLAYRNSVFPTRTPSRHTFSG